MATTASAAASRSAILSPATCGNRASHAGNGLSAMTWSKMIFSGHGSSRSVPAATSMATNAALSAGQCGPTNLIQFRRREAITSPPVPRSGVNHPPHRVEHRLGDRFAERRVRVDRQLDLLDGELVLARHGQLVNELRGVRADDVRAEDLAVLRVADDLHEALGLARRACAAVRAIRELAHLV